MFAYHNFVFLLYFNVFLLKNGEKLIVLFNF